MITLSYLLLSAAEAGNPDVQIERLERLERALHIEDCQYAVDELEHLGVAYSDLSFKYALMAEGYVCVGKPQKARLAMTEFLRLGGEPHQLSLRVQEFCAIQSCPVEPIMVKRVVEQQVDDPQEETTEDVPTAIVVPEVVAEVVPRIQSTDAASQAQQVTDSEVPTVDDVRIVPSVEPTEVIESEASSTVLSSRGDIEALISEGQCDEAQPLAQNLLSQQPENPELHRLYGDAVACFPIGNGDIFAAFDTWMLAKNLAKSQQTDWQPMRERLSWALERSGIVKLVPIFEDGYEDWPEGFAIEIEADTEVDLTPRTDHMLGGTYLTNLPTGSVKLIVRLGGNRADSVHQLSLNAGEMQKIRITVGKEDNVQLPSIPAPEGYSVTFIDEDENEVVYNPNEEMLIANKAYEVLVQYKEQQYSFQLDFERLEQEFVDLLPWVYLIRNSQGELLADGLVFPEYEVQDVSFVMDRVTYQSWKDGTEVGDEALELLVSGSISEVSGSLFTEEVLHAERHPFYAAAQQLQDIEESLERVEKRQQRTTAAMVTSAVTTVTMTVQSSQSDEEIWGRASLVGTAVTLPLVGLWMHHEVRGAIRHEQRLLRSIAAIESLDQAPILLSELQD